MAPKPTMRRKRFGAELQRLRKAAGLGIADVATTLECEQSKISRIENGINGVRPRDLRAILERYGITDKAAVEGYVNRAREADQRGWWASYADVLPVWAESYVELEAAADSIHNYQVQLINGLLQTEQYIRASFRAAAMLADDEMDRQVRLRLGRQALLADARMSLHAVIGQPAIMCSVGGDHVMCGQLKHLVKVSALPNVTLQVLPISVYRHAAMDSTFSILNFDDPESLSVAYVESIAGSIMIQEAADVELYSRSFAQLCSVALGPAESRAVITSRIEELT